MPYSGILANKDTYSDLDECCQNDYIRNQDILEMNLNNLTTLILSKL